MTDTTFIPLSEIRKPPVPDPANAPTEDIRVKLFELEEAGELIVQRVPEPYIEVMTKYGRTKKIPEQMTWHHKSCGQCGHIPGYSTSIFWLNRQFGMSYMDPTDQTSCTAWNYYASATSNAVAQAGVASRNFAAAYQTGYFPMIHCGTSYGHYKETRLEIVHHEELRHKVRDIMSKLNKPLVMPEEIVHYSEWIHAMRDRIAERQVRDFSSITASIHPACHYYKLVTEDAIYDPDIYGGQRTATVTGIVESLGSTVGDYSTFFDCCGFGFRHILVQRDFSRSFATQRRRTPMSSSHTIRDVSQRSTRASSQLRLISATLGSLFYRTPSSRRLRWVHTLTGSPSCIGTQPTTRCCSKRWASTGSRPGPSSSKTSNDSSAARSNT